MDEPGEVPSMPPPTTRTNVDTLAVTTPAPTDSSSALAGPRDLRAAAFATSTIAPMTARNPRAEAEDSSGLTFVCGTSSVSQSRPTATAMDPKISALYGLRPYR
ncbi:hypothetical protein [Nonomuraea recticatena]|uniref:hypothetical protein n=1 Tax=Nonomuraea recticatena TaxID=46178 RepID=UPI00361CA1FC